MHISRRVIAAASLAFTATGCSGTYEPEPTKGNAAEPAESKTEAAPGPVVTYETHGCNGAVVQVPRAGSALTAAALGLASSAFHDDAAGRGVTWLSSMECASTGRTHARRPREGREAIANTSYASSNWSGYQTNRTGQYVQAGWTVPTVTAPKPVYSTTGYYTSTWSGIGGGENTDLNAALIQSGTAQEISATGATSYYAWYEIVGGTHDTGGEVRISGFPVHAGDVVGNVAIWTPASGGQAQMGVCNFSSNVCHSFTLPSSQPGVSEEWIVEAPYFNGVLPLANYGSVTFVNSCWSPTYPGTTCASIQSGGPASLYLERYLFKAYQVLSLPGPLNATGNGFTVTYYPPERCPAC